MTATKRLHLIHSKPRRYRLERKVIENDPFAKSFPKWLKNIAIGGFREQGWAAYEQPTGRQIASGEWGESLELCSDGTIRKASNA